ncbi:hypothetical protein K491DRAFT_405309 [Lophiostoma macrostomum CBS 122681]|uniref:Uncharacterized protein n=1 Tax=Lophiostoma macrostomum CBS 122681 TaxID=1314788 RepID=A0A6A6T9J4_9PLEO|nr:hypothetical protein K491DRAFT_405309 [Lophiostoma macrostomum CBS 122681]
MEGYSYEICAVISCISALMEGINRLENIRVTLLGLESWRRRSLEAQTRVSRTYALLSSFLSSVPESRAPASPLHMRDLGTSITPPSPGWTREAIIALVGVFIALACFVFGLMWPCMRKWCSRNRTRTDIEAGLLLVDVDSRRVWRVRGGTGHEARED